MKGQESEKEPLTTVLDFVGSINRADPDGICRLITNDHLFIDSLGSEVRGKENVRQAWKNYFNIIADYRIEVIESFARNGVVVILGTASGTIRTAPMDKGGGTSWQVPAAWKAEVAGDKVALWQVFADNSLLRELINT